MNDSSTIDPLLQRAFELSDKFFNGGLTESEHAELASLASQGPPSMPQVSYDVVGLVVISPPLSQAGLTEANWPGSLSA